MIGEYIEGKTIKKVYEEDFSEWLIFLFTDGTFLKLEAIQGYDGVATIESFDDRAELDDDDLLVIGFITEEDIKQKQLNREAEARGRKREKDQREYERLKKIFGPLALLDEAGQKALVKDLEDQRDARAVKEENFNARKNHDKQIRKQVRGSE